VDEKLAVGPLSIKQRELVARFDLGLGIEFDAARVHIEVNACVGVRAFVVAHFDEWDHRQQRGLLGLV